MKYVGRMDGLLDFQYAYPVRRTLARGAWTEARLNRFLEDRPDYFPGGRFPAADLPR